MGLDEVGARVVACRRCPRLVELARAGRAREARRLPRRGRTGPGRCPASATRRARLRRRPRPGGARRQPHRPRVHRRPLRRLAVRRAAPRRLRQPADLASPRRRPAARGAYVTAAVRCAPPANKPTPEERDTCLPFRARELSCCASVRVVVCLGGFAWDAALRLRAARPSAPRAALRPRRRGADVEARPHAARLLPPQPAEHLHRPAHRADARRACSRGRASVAESLAKAPRS